MSRHAALAAFTLLELIMVVALLGVALSVMGIGVGRGLEAARERQVLGEMVAALRQARAQAVLQGGIRQLRFDPDSRIFQIPGQPPHHWPPGIALRLTGAAEAGGGIEFYPDGSSSGGHIVLERSGQRWRIDVGWLTGQVRWQAAP